MILCGGQLFLSGQLFSAGDWVVCRRDVAVLSAGGWRSRLGVRVFSVHATRAMLETGGRELFPMDVAPRPDMMPIWG